jgi:hypothetical protein
MAPAPVALMDHGDRTARTPVVLLIHDQIGRGEIGEWDDPAGHLSRAEVSGIVPPRKTSQNDGRAWPIVRLLARVRTIRPGGHDSADLLLVTQLTRIAQRPPHEQVVGATVERQCTGATKNDSGFVLEVRPRMAPGDRRYCAGQDHSNRGDRMAIAGGDYTGSTGGKVEDNSLGRLITLSDGVFATLLALDLRVPELPDPVTNTALLDELAGSCRAS